jgi:hypothetical protein
MNVDIFFKCISENKEDFMSEYDNSWYLSISQYLHEITEKTRQHPNMHILLIPLIFNIRSSALHVDHFVTYLVISNAWAIFFQEMLYRLSENLWDTCRHVFQDTNCSTGTPMYLLPWPETFLQLHLDMWTNSGWTVWPEYFIHALLMTEKFCIKRNLKVNKYNHDPVQNYAPIFTGSISVFSAILKVNWWSLQVVRERSPL